MRRFIIFIGIFSSCSFLAQGVKARHDQDTSKSVEVSSKNQLEVEKTLALAKENYRKANYLSALKNLNKLIRLGEKTSFVYNKRGSTKLHLGDLNGALIDYTTAIGIDPQNADAYYNRGIVHYDLGEYELAIDDFKSALKHNPKDANIYLQRGLAYKKLGKYHHAHHDFNKSIKYNPCHNEAYLARAQTKVALGEDACEDLASAKHLKNKKAKRLIDKHCK